jgi:serine/threonine protein kinase
VVDKWRYATEENSEREIRILSKVNHRNCIQMHAVYVTARRVYIITELVTGGELLDKFVALALALPSCEKHCLYFMQVI